MRRYVYGECTAAQYSNSKNILVYIIKSPRISFEIRGENIIASDCGVRRGIRDLKKAGLPETEQRYHKKGGKSSLLFRLKAE